MWVPCHSRYVSVGRTSAWQGCHRWSSSIILEVESFSQHRDLNSKGSDFTNSEDSATTRVEKSPQAGYYIAIMNSGPSYSDKTRWACAGPKIKLLFLLSPRVGVWAQDSLLGITGWWDSGKSYLCHSPYSLVAWSCLYNGKSACVHKGITERMQVKPQITKHITSVWYIEVVAGQRGQMSMNNVWRYGSSGHSKLLVKLDVGYPSLETSRNVCIRVRVRGQTHRQLFKIDVWSRSSRL